MFFCLVIERIEILKFICREDSSTNLQMLLTVIVCLPALVLKFDLWWLSLYALLCRKDVFLHLSY